MIRARLVYAAGLTALALAATGCHKKTTQAYHPPPPPTTTSASSARGKGNSPLGSGGDTAASGTAKSLPSPPPDPHGKPILTEVGMASWYGPPYAGRKGADGTVYDQNAMTAAHLTLPLGTTVRVTNLTTNQSAIVRITDRGPFVHGRIIDLSLAAAKATGLYRMGVAKVRVEAYAAPARPNAVPGGRWCVQIGAFPNEEDAIQLKNHLIRKYSTAKVIEFAGPTGHWVRINPQQPDKAHATEVAEGIHVPDAEPYVIRTD
ncbi:rare lipoprotein A [Edaphobacter aggregans]|uniref:Probable endolytic peptidoglycan transglycosylase RlpA n=1 Tax=Edaphobacter aggregans TaxID=570835 RepID=A0A3R9WGJ4_9BACT|nr:septal ring lytic transglycosylase RlpA family protein [Edaphobacter aggregans]RSL16711.1 rare lipoprotein A [Edaphobacter aggregans]